MGSPRCCNNIPVLCSSVTCLHAKPAAPTPSTGPTLPYMTHPRRDVPLYLWATPTERGPAITLVVNRSRVSGLEGDDQETFVFVFSFSFSFFFFWNITSSKRRREELGGTKSHRQKSWGDTRSVRRIGVEGFQRPRYHRSRALRRAPVCKVPPVEGARGQRQY